MRKHHLLLTLFFLGLAFYISAQELPPEVTFPITELGGCANEAECRDYCDLPENAQACLDFAEAHNLLSQEEIKRAREMLELEETGGPGGCRSETECEAYCEDISHIEECLAFAEEHDLIPPEELEEAKKVAAAIKQGISPPNCNTKSECDIYCSRPENMEECIAFAKAAGLIPQDELEEAEMVLAAIKKGAKPPPCKGEAECDIYCQAPEHLEECLTFAEAAGFITPEEAAMVRKTGGKGPGGCRGEEECEAYCEDPAHAEECINFALEYGFMSPEEAEQAKRMLAAGLTTGPGGCQGEEECEAYCNDLAHMKECVDFAEQAGFMSHEEAERARKMAEMGVMGGPGGCQGEEECSAFCEDPANMEECLNFAVQIGDMTPEEAGQARQGVEMMQQGGPGGCRSEEECRIYCEDPSHAIECTNFAVEQGFMSEEEAQRMMEMMQIVPTPPRQEVPGAPPEGMPEQPPEEMMGPPPQGMEIPEGMELPGGMEIPEGMMPPGEIPQEMTPPPEETSPLLEEMMKQEEAPPPSQEQEPPPESFFEMVEQFLATVAAFLGFQPSF